MSKNLRIKCPSCGNVADVPGNGNCAKCNNPLVLPEDGVIQMYRMGNPLGMAVGFGIYLNDTLWATSLTQSPSEFPYLTVTTRST